MKTRRSIVVLSALVVGLLAAPPAHAAFHLMQIEQVIGGVNGDVSAQAIQLRMRGLGQNFMSGTRIKAWDAAGANPVLIVNMTTDVTNGAAGDRVLITSSAFQNYVSPVQTPNFTMANLIPASFLAAGSLTFEDDFGTVYWRLSWGGAVYTGSGAMSTFNDLSGNANPPYAGALPSTDLRALRFGGTAAALSTSNSVDYALTSGASVWTNNARLSETVVIVAAVGDPPGASGVQLGAPSPNPVTGALNYSVSLPRAARVHVAVYDVRGQLVRTLLDRSLPAGRNNLTWDARGGAGARLASGVYYLMLEADGERQSRKFVIVR
jgi:hypothetical protein